MNFDLMNFVNFQMCTVSLFTVHTYCIHYWLTGAFHPSPLKRSFVLKTYLTQVKSSGYFCLIESSVSQVASRPSWPLHKTFTTRIVLRLNTFSARSKIFTGRSGIVRSGRTSGWLASITASGSDKHFLNCDTWNTLCTPARLGGNANRYATGPILSNTSYGPMYLQQPYISHIATYHIETTSTYFNAYLGLSFPLTPNL